MNVTEWDFVLLAKELKQKQQEMQECITNIVDILNALKEEASLLKDKWKGSARDAFLDLFDKALVNANTLVQETGNLIMVYTEVESTFESCEKRISAMDY